MNLTWKRFINFSPLTVSEFTASQGIRRRTPWRAIVRGKLPSRYLHFDVAVVSAESTNTNLTLKSHVI